MNSGKFLSTCCISFSLNLILPKMFIFHCNFSFRRSIEAIHGYEDKVRIVLNKADQVDHQELMRVYGALMWSIAKVRKNKLIYRNVVFPPERESIQNYTMITCNFRS